MLNLHKNVLCLPKIGFFLNENLPIELEIKARAQKFCYSPQLVWSPIKWHVIWKVIELVVGGLLVLDDDWWNTITFISIQNLKIFGAIPKPPIFNNCVQLCTHQKVQIWLNGIKSNWTVLNCHRKSYGRCILNKKQCVYRSLRETPKRRWL